MNRHRWTCLTTLVLTTVLAPFATTVNAKTLTALVPVSREVRVSLASSSLPIVTPLTVTELQTDVAVPTVNRVVPTVSQLPIVKPIAVGSRKMSKVSKFSLQEKLPIPQPYSASITAVKFRPTNISFNPKLKAIDPVFTESPQVEAPKGVVAQPSTPVIQPPASTSFTTSKTAEPIAIIGNDGTPSAQIVHSATVRAEIAAIPQPVPSVAPLNSDSAYQPETLPVPQPAPIIATSQDRVELPSFEAGAPVFIFDSERPQQIVTTTIAQIDGETVAAEPSIAIPVHRPKQDTIPPRSAVPLKSAQQPEVTGVVTIEEPTETIQPASDKIVVSTHTGKASWYGSEGGSRTANGERYNPNGLTAAHRTLPFGTKVRVTSLKTGKSAIVRINDRGPFIRNRIIDVSAATAAAIGIKGDGIGEVKMEVLADEG